MSFARRFFLAVFLTFFAAFAFSDDFLIDFKSDFPGRVFIDGVAFARVKSGEVKRLVSESQEISVSLKLDDGFASEKNFTLASGINKLQVSYSERYWKGCAARSDEMPALSGASPKFAKGDIVEVQIASGEKVNVKIVDTKPLGEEQIIMLSEDAFSALNLDETTLVSVRKIFVWK